MEPLNLIREAATSNATINCVDGFYIFGDKKFDVNTKTAFRRTHQSQKGSSYYSMRDVIFFLEHVNTAVAEYRQLAYKASCVAIVTADTKNLKNYLTGKIDNCEQIDRHMATRKPAASASVDVVETLTAEKLETLNNFRKKRRLEAVVAPQSHQDQALDPEFLYLDKAQLTKLRSDEYAANTRNSLLLGASDVNYAFVQKIFGEHVLRPDRVAAQHPERPLNANPAQGRTPIIILPNSTSSCLTMLNALDFLQNGAFVSPDDKRKAGAAREASVLLKRTDPVTGSIKMFKLMDNPLTLSSDDWGRVVAVFVSGQAWQFKNWKWSSPVDLFKNVLGVYLTFDDRPVDSNVSSWNCKTIKIKQFERHQDAGASMTFWTMLDNYMQVRKPA